MKMGAKGAQAARGGGDREPPFQTLNLEWSLGPIYLNGTTYQAKECVSLTERERVKTKKQT